MTEEPIAGVAVNIKAPEGPADYGREYNADVTDQDGITVQIVYKLTDLSQRWNVTATYETGWTVGHGLAMPDENSDLTIYIRDDTGGARVWSSVTVKDQSNAPVVGAEVDATSPSMDFYEYNVTDGSGVTKMLLPALSNALDSYTIRATKEGYTAASTHVIGTMDSTASLTIRDDVVDAQLLVRDSVSHGAIAEADVDIQWLVGPPIGMLHVTGSTNGAGQFTCQLPKSTTLDTITVSKSGYETYAEGGTVGTTPFSLTVDLEEGSNEGDGGGEHGDP